MIFHRKNMIYCIECIFKGWSHQEVNSGLIKEIAQVSGATQVCVVAEKTHVEVLKTYNYEKDINFIEYQMRAVRASNFGEDECNFIDYIVYLKQLFSDIMLKEGDRVLFMSSNRGILVALELLALQYKNVKFFFVMHAILEKTIEEGMIKETKRFLTMKNILRLLALNSNIFLISYAPRTKQILKKYLPHKALKQVVFLNLPVDRDSDQEAVLHENSIRIALLGAAVNSDGVKVINKVLEKTKSERIEFVVLDRRTVQNSFSDTRVKVTRKIMGFDEKEIREAILKSDWILLPYDSTKYQISASGIFADSIRYGKPILALNSPYIMYYNNKMKIGFIEDSVDDLVDRIVQIAEGIDVTEYLYNVKKLGNKMIKYNQKKLIQLLDLTK